MTSKKSQADVLDFAHRIYSSMGEDFNSNVGKAMTRDPILQAPTASEYK